MKQLIRWTLAALVAGLAAQWNAGASAQNTQAGTEQNTVLTIHADGTSKLVSRTIQPRAILEQEIRSMERFQQMTEGGAKTSPGTNTAAAKPKPLSDQELTQKVRDLWSERTSRFGEGSGNKIDVKLEKDKIETDSTRTFASLKELLQQGSSIWSAGGVAFSNTRLETDTNGLLRLTLTPITSAPRYVRMMKAQWKLSGTKSTLKLVFPGKVVSSSFPEKQTNATWMVIDASDDASLDAAMKMYEKPVVITAEAGGLKLNEPLESRALQRSLRGGEMAGEDLPITDAGPGFVAEALTVTTTTIHVFPQGTNYANNDMFGNSPQAGVVIRAKLFAPRGRTLLSVSGARILKATDDKGREIKPGEDGGESMFQSYSGGSSEQSSAMPFQLQLQLPRPDAQAINELDGEVIAVTAGNWKEMTLTNLQQNATNELDLSAVLPEAKLAITKLEVNKNQTTLQARITGPKTIRSLELKAEIPGNHQFNSNSSDRGFHTRNGKSTRTISIQGYAWGDGNLSSQSPLVLVVRHPEDLHRERVHFNLKALDLL